MLDTRQYDRDVTDVGSVLFLFSFLYSQLASFTIIPIVFLYLMAEFLPALIKL